MEGVTWTMEAKKPSSGRGAASGQAVNSFCQQGKIPDFS
jgi:hypothetical protein